MRQSVKQFLSKLTGPEKVEVLVASTLNFDQVTQKDNLVTPVDTENMKGIEISAQKIQKSYTGQANGVGGIAGTGEQDVPGYPSAGTGNGSSSEDRITSYNVCYTKLLRMDIPEHPAHRFQLCHLRH